MSSIGFVFNLDAELEWADPAYRRSTRMQAEIDNRARFLVPWVEAHEGQPTHAIRTDRASPEKPSRVLGWAPSRSLLSWAARAEIELDPAPPLDVVQRVNHRRFGFELAAELDATLDGAKFTTDSDDVFAELEANPTREFVLKRAFGFAGRMQKRLLGRAISAGDRRWILESMRGYGVGLVVEPVAQRTADFSRHGWLHTDGDLALGSATEQRIDPAGRWLGFGSAALTPTESARLEVALRATADALREQSYFGPFGIDAFRYVTTDGEPRFCPLVEINGPLHDGVVERDETRLSKALASAPRQEAMNPP